MSDIPSHEQRFRDEQAAIAQDYADYKVAHPGNDSLLAFYRWRDRRDHAQPIVNAYVDRILGPVPEPGSEG